MNRNESNYGLQSVRTRPQFVRLSAVHNRNVKTNFSVDRSFSAARFISFGPKLRFSTHQSTMALMEILLNVDILAKRAQCQ